MKALVFFKTSGNINLATQNHTPKDVTSKQNWTEKLKSVKYSNFLSLDLVGYCAVIEHYFI
jgi:hypothetical protein